MNKLSRWVLGTVSVLLLGLTTLFLILQHRETLQKKGSEVSAIIFGIDDYLSQPFLPLQSLIDNTEHLFATYDENETLKKENVLLRLENSQLKMLQEENRVLKEGLKLLEQTPATFAVSARVRARTPIKWYEKLIVDQGKQSGVETGMLVLSEGGLIGLVTEVHGKSSVVTLLTNDKQFSPVPVKVSVNDETIFGVLIAYDEAKEAFVMSQLSSEKGITEGSQVVTSGLDGRSVADLSVGAVVATEDNQDLLLRKVYVKSLVDFSDVAEVMIVGE